MFQLRGEGQQGRPLNGLFRRFNDREMRFPCGFSGNGLTKHPPLHPEWGWVTINHRNQEEVR